MTRYYGGIVVSTYTGASWWGLLNYRFFIFIIVVPLRCLPGFGEVGKPRVPGNCFCINKDGWNTSGL